MTTGGKKTPHVQKNDKSLSSLVFGRVPTLNEKRRRSMAGRAKQSDGTFFPDGDGW